MSNFCVASGFNSIGIQSAGGAGKVLARMDAAGEPPWTCGMSISGACMPFQRNRRYLQRATVEGAGPALRDHFPYPAGGDRARHSPIAFA